MPRAGSGKKYDYRDKCPGCDGLKNQASDQCWACYVKERVRLRAGRHDECPSCGGKKLSNAALCVKCFNAAKKVDPVRFICPQCDGPKHRDAKYCEQCKPKCQECGLAVGYDAPLCRFCLDRQIVNGECTCLKCLRRLPIGSFHTNKQTQRARTNCKECVAKQARSRNIRVKCKKYGLPSDLATKLDDIETVKCNICKQKVEKFHIDHCHDTGLFRGILCAGCNTGMGLFQDNVEVLERAISYLNRFGTTRMIVVDYKGKGDGRYHVYMHRWNFKEDESIIGKNSSPCYNRGTDPPIQETSVLEF